MKAILFALTMIAGSHAFAAANCQSYFVGTGEAGQGYYVYPCDKPVTNHRGCNEGEIGYFPTTQYGAEGGPVEERRVCHNGTFFPKTSSHVKVRSCIEGEITYIPTTQTGGEGGYYEVARVCRHGKFVRAN